MTEEQHPPAVLALFKEVQEKQRAHLAQYVGQPLTLELQQKIARGTAAISREGVDKLHAILYPEPVRNEL